MVVARAKLVVSGSKLSGRQSWRLLWEASRPLSLGVLAWAAADAVDGPLVVTALGVVVGAIPAAVAGGLSSSAGHRLIGALIIAALLYTASLILDPIGGALSTVAYQRITDRLQARLLRAVTAPATIAHLEDQDTLNRLASAEGSLTGFFPGDAPVTLLVSHRFATVRMADVIVYLEAGHAVEAGTHDELMSANGRYAELFTLQAAGYN